MSRNGLSCNFVLKMKVHDLKRKLKDLCNYNIVSFFSLKFDDFAFQETKLQTMFFNNQ